MSTLLKRITNNNNNKNHHLLVCQNQPLHIFIPSLFFFSPHKARLNEPSIFSLQKLSRVSDPQQIGVWSAH